MPRSVASISPTLAARIARTDSERSDIGTDITSINRSFARTSSLARSQQFLQCNELTVEEARRVFDGNHTIAVSLKFAAAQVIIAATLPRERDNSDTEVLLIPSPPHMPANTRRSNIPPPPVTIGERELVQVDEDSVAVPLQERDSESPVVDERFGAFAIVAPAAANVPKSEESDSSEQEPNPFLFGERNGRRSTLVKVFEKSRSRKRASTTGTIREEQLDSENDKNNSNLQQREREQVSRRWVWCF